MAQDEIYDALSALLARAGVKWYPGLAVLAVFEATEMLDDPRAMTRLEKAVELLRKQIAILRGESGVQEQAPEAAKPVENGGPCETKGAGPISVKVGKGKSVVTKKLDGRAATKKCVICGLEKGLTGFSNGSDTCRKCHSTTSVDPAPAKANGTPKLVVNVLPAEAKKIESGNGLAAIQRSVLAKLDRAHRDVAHLSVGGQVRWVWTRAELEAAVGVGAKAVQ